MIKEGKKTGTTTMNKTETYRKNSNIIRTFVQYAPQTLMGELWENVSFSV